jgi:D-alanyl-D-alanine carboxypeptidase (penicillin-binding protein 5/6)
LLNRLRLYCTWMLVILFLAGFWVCPVCSADILNIDAKAAVLMEWSTGQILYQKNADEKLSIASITKVMTILLAMEALEEGSIRLDDKVTISRAASDMGGSQIWLAPGDVVTVEDLLKAAAVPSANDAAYALGEYVGGHISWFVDRMNERARELGMVNTSFKNPTGLDETGQYSSAMDVALMARELINHGKVLEWTSSWTIQISIRDQLYANTNKLVNPVTGYEYIDGLKTGSTSNAGNALVATGCIDDVRLIAVVLGAPSDNKRYSEAIKLMDYGFRTFEPVVLEEAGKSLAVLDIPDGNLAKIDLVLSEDLKAMVPRGLGDKIEFRTEVVENYSLPITAGTVLGKVSVFIDGEEVLQKPLVAAIDVVRAGRLVVLLRRIRSFFSGVLSAIAARI